MNNSQNSGIKIFGSVMIIVGTMIGAGILALPIITAKLGFLLSTAIIIIVWSIMTYTALVISDVSCSMPYGSSFKSIAEKYLGKIGGIVATISFLVLMYCISTAYISAAASSLKITFPFLSEETWSLLFVLIFGGIVAFGTKMVDYANRFFIILKIVVLILLCYVLNDYIDTKNLLASPINLGASLLIAIPIFATSFTSHIIVPALSDYLNKNKRDMRNIVIIGSVIPLILYLVWLTTILGVLPLNGEVSFMHTIFDKVPVENANIGDILTALGDKVQTSTTDIVLHVFTYVAIMTSFLSVNLSLLHFNIDSYNLDTKFKNKFTVIAIGILLTFTIPVLIIQINPNIFIYAMTYVGVCIAVLLLILPALISYKIYVNKGTFNYKISSIKILWLVSFMSGVLIIACVMI